MNEEIKELGGAAGADAGSDEGVYDVDGIVDMFADDEGESDTENSQTEDVDGDSEIDASAEEQEPSEPNEDDQEPAPDVPMPEGFEEAVWQGLTPEAREAVNAREQAHAQAMVRAEQEKQTVLQQREQFAIAANAQIQQALATMKQIVEGEYGGVDWNGLAQSDPATYIKLQQAYNARVGAIQRVQQGVAQATKQYEAQRAQEARKAMASEFAQVQPEIKALIGAGFDSKTLLLTWRNTCRSRGVLRKLSTGLPVDTR